MFLRKDHDPAAQSGQIGLTSAAKRDRLTKWDNAPRKRLSRERKPFFSLQKRVAQEDCHA
jgi:hypothetical protein